MYEQENLLTLSENTDTHTDYADANTDHYQLLMAEVLLRHSCMHSRGENAQRPLRVTGQEQPL